MNPTGLLLFLACCFVSRAQSTNAPARLDYPSFKIITERNIFDPNRSARSGKGAGPDSRRPAKVESFALVGTLGYEKGMFAFFDGSGAQFKKVLKAGDTIAGYKIREVAPSRVMLEANGQQVELGVGVQMKKQDEGDWQLAGRTESFDSPSPVVASSAKTDDTSVGEESDVLKKLMQKREQELK